MKVIRIGMVVLAMALLAANVLAQPAASQPSTAPSGPAVSLKAGFKPGTYAVLQSTKTKQEMQRAGTRVFRRR